MYLPICIYFDILQISLQMKLKTDGIKSTIVLQDSASPHFTQTVQDYLSEQFNDRWIGCSSHRLWVPWSADLTPLDHLYYHIHSYYNWITKLPTYCCPKSFNYFFSPYIGVCMYNIGWENIYIIHIMINIVSYLWEIVSQIQNYLRIF